MTPNKNQTWQIFIEEKSVMLHGHFSFLVHDRLNKKKLSRWLHAFGENMRNPSLAKSFLRVVHWVRHHFLGGQGSKIEEKVLTNKYKKVGRWVLKIAKKALTYFMDGPLEFFTLNWHHMGTSYMSTIVRY